MQTVNGTTLNREQVKAEINIINTVYETVNYNMFRKITGNRDLSLLNINRLKRSFEEKQLQIPIIINELNEVIDGQHRLEVCRELNLPVCFITVKGYDLEDVQRANRTARQWNIDDCIDSYCDLGNENYKTYRNFKHKYNFGHYESRLLLELETWGNSKASEWLKSGRMVCNRRHIIEGSRKAEMIFSVEPYYKGFKRRYFVKAMIELFKNPKYNHRTFIRKLSFQTMALQDQARVDQYIQNIETIYNYKNRDRVRFL